MSRRKLSENNIRKLSKVGGGTTYNVTILLEMVKELGWKEKQKVVFEKKGNNILIKDWKK